MKLTKILIMLSLLSLMMFSCSDGEEDHELVGSWTESETGSYYGNDYTLSANLTFSSSAVNMTMAMVCDEIEEGAPQCIKDCTGWNDSFDEENNITDACTWLNGLNLQDTCLNDCTDIEMEEITEYDNLCEECIANDNCDDYYDDGGYDDYDYGCQDESCFSIGTWSVDAEQLNQLSLMFPEVEDDDSCLSGDFLMTYYLNGNSLSVTITDSDGYDYMFDFTRD